MSWLSAPPVEIIPALNRLVEVIIERYHYMFPSQSTDYEEGFQFLPTPAEKDTVKRKISDIKRHIAVLYTYHFPVKNFGVCQETGDRLTNFNMIQKKYKMLSLPN